MPLTAEIIVAHRQNFQPHWAELLCMWVISRAEVFNLVSLSVDYFGRGLSLPGQSSSAQCLSCSAVFPGELINWLALDREHRGHHHMTVLVTDHGSPPRNATMVVYVTITDINDNRPFFPQCLPGKEFHIKVCEAALQWAFFLQSFVLSAILWSKVGICRQSWYNGVACILTT